MIEQINNRLRESSPICVKQLEVLIWKKFGNQVPLHGPGVSCLAILISLIILRYIHKIFPEWQRWRKSAESGYPDWTDIPFG
jgi:hypothetical protein